MSAKLISTRQEGYSGNEISSKLFSYSGDIRLFTADASQLRDASPFDCLYEDAADQGFLMLSAKSGDLVPFVLASVDTHGGDIAGWHFVPDGYSVKKRPSLAGLRVLIVNT